MSSERQTRTDADADEPLKVNVVVVVVVVVAAAYEFSQVRPRRTRFIAIDCRGAQLTTRENLSL